MSPQDIAAFIQKHAGDATPEAIKDALVSSGVSEEMFDRIWKSAQPASAVSAVPSPPPPLPQNPVQTSPQALSQSWDESLLGSSVAAETPLPPAPIASEPLVTAPSGVAAEVHTRRGSKMSVVMVVVASFLLGGAAFAYWSFVEPRLRPIQVFENMRAALLSVTGANYQGSLSITIDEIQPGLPGQSTAVHDLLAPLMFTQAGGDESKKASGAVEISFSGGFDTLDSENPKTSLSIDFGGTFAGNTYALGMDALMTEKTIYTKFEKIGETVPQLKEVEGKWIRMEVSKIGSEMGSIVPMESVGKETMLTATGTVPSELQQKVTRLFENANFLLLEDKGSEKTEMGILAYHYGVGVDKEGLKAFLLELLNAAYENGTQYKGLHGMPNTKEEGAKALVDALTMLGTAQGEIWIGKEDFLPYIVKLNLELLDPKQSSAVHLLFVLQFANFNKPLTVAVPTNSMTIEEVLPLVGFGATTTTATTTEVNVMTVPYDTQRIADMGMLRSALALYHDAKKIYPKDFTELNAVGFLPQIPLDPETGGEYFYATDQKKTGYHIGTTLTGGDPIIDTDSDFDSKGKEYISGFDGGDTIGCDGVTPGACFDISFP